LAAAVKVTEPLPLPDVPLVMAIQFTLTLAVHAQWPAATIVTDPVPPEGPTV
jgi:hypothetical protein